MWNTNSGARISELRAMLAAYECQTVEEAEQGDWADIQAELETELWRLEEDGAIEGGRRSRAA